ncbi:hypothetical protein AVEN_14109-1 [Araneus ventricosus]|uniref:Pre-C2HC domain-containing protein n=1 Tax=Araneus ventricosus TaxID=182803 RepID=A0A4Y2TKX9_ARAVE|nr:hypothetical protein AVEN_14109-1 [Araneus ventricosus]
MKRLNETKNWKCRAKPVGEFMHVFTNSSKDHRDLTDYLTEQNIQYYVVPLRAEKPVKIVIKGLPGDTKTDKIEEGLTSKGFKVAKVNQLLRFRDKKPLDIFQAHLLKSENLKDIYKLDNLNYFIIRVKKYERKTVGQCFYCQKFNHHSSECNMTVKCVLCAEEHNSRTCPNKRNPEFTPKCANFGGPHTASYRGCPNFPKIKKVTTEKTFASVLKERRQPSTTTTKALNQEIQLAEIPDAIDTGLPPSQELANISLPTDLQVNKEELTDLFRFLKQMQLILAKVSNVKQTLEEMGKTEDPYNKFFILSEEMNENTKQLSDPSSFQT